MRRESFSGSSSLDMADNSLWQKITEQMFSRPVYLAFLGNLRFLAGPNSWLINKDILFDPILSGKCVDNSKYKQKIVGEREFMLSSVVHIRQHSRQLPSMPHFPVSLIANIGGPTKHPQIIDAQQLYTTKVKVKWIVCFRETFGS